MTTLAEGARFSTDTVQMWACTGCTTRRQWGIGRPEDTKIQPLLICEGVCPERPLVGKLTSRLRAHVWVGEVPVAKESVAAGEFVIRGGYEVPWKRDF